MRELSSKDVLWGYISQFLNIGSGILLLPAILSSMQEDEIGMWFVFITLASLTQLLEFGFQPTISRNITYVFMGAQTLTKSGLPFNNLDRNDVNYKLLSDIVKSSKRIYRKIAAISVFILFILGSLYIKTLVHDCNNLKGIITGWILFSAGYIVTFYFGYLNSILIGIGEMSSSNIVNVVSRVSFLVFGFVGLKYGYALIGLGVASLIGSLLGRGIAKILYEKTGISNKIERFTSQNIENDITAVLWHNSSKLGLTQIGAFLIQKANILIASSFLGLKIAASYGITITSFSIISQIALTLCINNISHMNAERSKGNIASLKKIYGKILLAGWVTFIIGFISLILFGGFMLEHIKSKTELLPFTLILLIGIIQFLEVNHSIAAAYLTTKNEVPFAKAALGSGLLIILLSLFFVRYIGIYAIVLTQGLVQLCYNNWKWPTLAFRDLNTNIYELSTIGWINSFNKK